LELVDGVKIQGWLYRARPNPKRAVIRIHGGPSRHAEDAFDAQIQYLVHRGFNVLTVNYRGSTGFGLRFRDAIKEDGWAGVSRAISPPVQKRSSRPGSPNPVTLALPARPLADTAPGI